MPALSFESVQRDLKRGTVAPTYYLTGPADLLKDTLLGAIVEAAVPPEARAFNVDVRSAGDVDVATLHALVETVPTFADRRVVVLKGLEQWRKNAKTWDALRRYLSNPSPSTTLILVHGADEKADPGLVRSAAHVHFTVPSPDNLRRWVVERARHHHLDLEAEALEHLLRCVGPNLEQLATELEKLAAAVGSEKAINASEIETLVGVHRGETVDDWLEAVTRRDLGRALRLTDVVLPQAGVTAVRMLMALGTELVGIRLARALADGGLSGPPLERAVFDEIQRSRPAGVRDWRGQARTWSAAAQRWRAAELNQALRSAYAADVALKSTTVSDDRATLRTLLLSFAATEAAA